MVQYTLPIVQHQGQIRGYDQSMEVDVTYDFTVNSDEWQLAAVAWEVGANETFLPLVPGEVVRLKNSVIVNSFTPDGHAVLGTGEIRWDILSNFNIDQKWSGVANLDLNSTVPKSFNITVKHNFVLPVVPLTEQVCNFTDTLSLVFVSRVAQPTNTPLAGAQTENKISPAPNPYLNWFSGLGVGVVVAGAAVLALLILKR